MQLADGDNLYNIVQHAPIGICILDAATLTAEVANDKFLEFAGKHKDNVTGKWYWDIFAGARSYDEAALAGMAKTGEPYYAKEFQLKLARRGQEENVFVTFVYAPVKNDKGQVSKIAVWVLESRQKTSPHQATTELTGQLTASNQQLISINEEMTASNEELVTTNEKLNQTQQALEATVNQLKQSRSRFQNLIREANIGIIVLTGTKMSVEIVNKTYGKLIGRTVEELRGRNLFDIIPEAEPIFRPIIDKVRVTGETLYLYDTPYLVYSERQEVKGYLNLVYQPFIEDDQSDTGVVIICQDVTGQVEAKISLQSAYEQLRLSKEAAQLGFFDMDMKGKLEWDARCRELFGISHTGTVTYEKDFVNGLHPDDKDRVLAIIDNVFIKSVSNGVYDVEYRTVGAEDQQVRWVRAKGQAYFDQGDKPIRFIGSVLDITEQKQDELRKNDFIGMVSHELKTPLTSLTAIVQMASLKLKNSEDPFLAGAMEKAGVQVKRMGNMINGFLNVSRLESAKLSIDKHKFDLKELVEEIVKETELTISSHAIDQQYCESVLINADRDKIGSVITNLISNAIKYSPKAKTIEVKCQVRGKSVQVSVKDEGMGLKPQDKDKVFDRYFRVESNFTRHISGFGIGLYLSAEIIQRHNGYIWVESEVDNGSTFYFSLPLTETTI